MLCPGQQVLCRSCDFGGFGGKSCFMCRAEGWERGPPHPPAAFWKIAPLDVLLQRF